MVEEVWTVDDGGEGDVGRLGKDVDDTAEDGLIACVERFEDLGVELGGNEIEGGVYLDVFGK